MNGAMIALLFVFCLAPLARAQSPADVTTPVTVQNFARAESDNYFATNVRRAGLGRLAHNREPASIEDQTVIRLNRDTLYSFGVFDLAAAPVTITLPDAGKRFMSLMIVNEDHYVPFVAYDTKPHTLTEQNVGSRYVLVAIRTLVDPNDPKDLDEVHKLQNGIKVSQKEVGKLELPNWDQSSLKEIRAALLVLARHANGSKGAFGAKNEVDPVMHLIGTAAGWGGNPDKDATYVGGRQRRTTAGPYTGSASRMCRLTPSGRSAFTMREAILKGIPTMLIRSITSRRRKAPMAVSSFSSVAAMGRFPTAFPSCRAGTTPCDYIARAPKY